MQKLGLQIYSWAFGYLVMFINWVDGQISFVKSFFPAYDSTDPAHLEYITRTAMNFLGAVSFVVGIVIAIMNFYILKKKGK